MVNSFLSIIRVVSYIYNYIYTGAHEGEGPKERTSAVYPNINRARARTKSRRQLAVQLSGSFFALLAARFKAICGNCTLSSGLRPSSLMHPHASTPLCACAAVGQKWRPRGAEISYALREISQLEIRDQSEIRNQKSTRQSARRFQTL